MKILILANNDVGLFKFRRELLEKLVEKYEIYVSVPDGEYIDEIKTIGCKVIVDKLLDRRGTNPVQDIKLMRHYNQIVRDIAPGVVLTYTIKPNVYGGMVCRWKKIPYIANITGLGTAIENGGILRELSLMLYKAGLARAEKVFFQNREDLDFFQKHGITAGKHELLPGSGVNLERFSATPLPGCGDGQTGEPVKFAFINRIMKEKGIDLYLTAAEEIQKQYPAVEFHICGFCEKEYDGRLDEMVRKGTVTYHGMIRDVSEFMSRMHCIVHPTYYSEGLSNVLLEACACGRAIITTDRAGCREAFEEGVTGIGIAPKNSEDLVRAIKEFISLPYMEKEAMGRAGRRKMEREFNRDIVVEKYMAEIDKIKESQGGDCVV